MDVNGQIVDDPHGMRLTQRFFQTYAEKNRQIINNEYRNFTTTSTGHCRKRRGW